MKQQHPRNGGPLSLPAYQGVVHQSKVAMGDYFLFSSKLSSSRPFAGFPINRTLLGRRCHTPHQGSKTPRQNRLWNLIISSHRPNFLPVAFRILRPCLRTSNRFRYRRAEKLTSPMRGGETWMDMDLHSPKSTPHYGSRLRPSLLPSHYPPILSDDFPLLLPLRQYLRPRLPWRNHLHN
jgi:hypothetical protein